MNVIIMGFYERGARNRKIAYIPCIICFLLMIFAVLEYIDWFWGPIMWLLAYLILLYICESWEKNYVWMLLFTIVLLFWSILFLIEGYLRWKNVVEGGIVAMIVGIIGIVYGLYKLPKNIAWYKRASGINRRTRW